MIHWKLKEGYIYLLADRQAALMGRMIYGFVSF